MDGGDQVFDFSSFNPENVQGFVFKLLSQHFHENIIIVIRYLCIQTHSPLFILLQKLAVDNER